MYRTWIPIVGDEEEAQAESAAAISVAVSDNLEAFEHGDDIFARHALAQGTRARYAGNYHKGVAKRGLARVHVDGDQHPALT